MNSLQNKLSLLVLCALVAAATCQVSQGGPHGPQGGPHQNQGRIRRQVPQVPEEDQLPNWVACDVTTTPVISCADCNTRLICKPVGGLLKQCNNPMKPYCNNGICSPIAAAGC